MANKKRYAIVGTGGRATMFINPLARDYTEAAELVALCDLSQVRMNYYRDRLKNELSYGDVPAYHADDFERMVHETNPDVVIVCTMDATHHEYIIKALHLGCDVVTEKPMTTDDEKCRAIFEAVERTGRKVRVTFNMRWSAGTTKVRQLLQQGAIGKVNAVNLEYLLSTAHGPEYFRRWHSDKSCSGGLLVHKSTHHFDLVNWWIDSIPEKVFAFGDLMFYGKQNAVERGQEKHTRYERYVGAKDAEDDPFKFEYDELLTSLYLNAEQETGYVRDRNVFRSGINIEDTMGVLVRYRTGVILNYSLVAYSPVEGFRVTFTGDKGCMEYSEHHAAHIIPKPDAEDMITATEADSGYHINLRLIPMFERGYDVPIELGEGDHGGADPLIQEQIFSAQPQPEVDGRNAGHEQGAASILIGIAANHSITSGQPVCITDLCPINLEAKHLSELI